MAEGGSAELGSAGYTNSNANTRSEGTNTPTISSLGCLESQATRLQVPVGRVWYSLIVYVCQVLVLLCVIATALVNISYKNDDQIWKLLLASCLGYLLPNPSLKKKVSHFS